MQVHLLQRYHTHQFLPLSSCLISIYHFVQANQVFTCVSLFFDYFLCLTTCASFIFFGRILLQMIGHFNLFILFSVISFVLYCQICSRIISISEHDERLRKLFISKDSSSTNIPFQLFVDKAVYSRNRCFRLALSSKAGKSSVLLPSGRFKCKDKVCNFSLMVFITRLIMLVGDNLSSA